MTYRLTEVLGVISSAAFFVQVMCLREGGIFRKFHKGVGGQRALLAVFGGLFVTNPSRQPLFETSDILRKPPQGLRGVCGGGRAYSFQFCRLCSTKRGIQW